MPPAPARPLQIQKRAAALASSLLAVIMEKRFDVWATMTLLLLLVYTGSYRQIRVLLIVLSVLAFIFAPLRRSAIFWLLVTVIVGVGNYQIWFQADNHKYLLGYWCLALFCALLTRDPEKSIAVTARWLIALAFLFAVFWKVASGNYLDGSFFQHTLLLDKRFNGIAMSLGGLTEQMNEVNFAALGALLSHDSTLNFVQLRYPASIVPLAVFMTWSLFVTEALVALAFLWPQGKLLSDCRDFFLLLFILSTYAIAPVTGFGWVLAIMGMAQCTDRSKYTPLLYVISFVLIQAFRFPWTDISVSLFE